MSAWPPLALIKMLLKSPYNPWSSRATFKSIQLYLKNYIARMCTYLETNLETRPGMHGHQGPKVENSEDARRPKVTELSMLTKSQKCEVQ